MYVTLPNSFAVSQAIEGRAVRPERKAKLRSHRKTRTGQTLFLEDDSAHHLFEVVSGVVRLSRVTHGGRRQIIAFGFPGDIIGFPLEGRHHADCDVIEDGDVLVYPTRVLEAPGDDPELHRYLMRAAMEEIGGMQDHFMVLGRKCANERIAAFLAVLAARVGQPIPGGTSIKIPMYRSDIADFLGLSSETVSRSFTQLKERGIVVFKTAKDLIIPDMRALVDLIDAE